MTLDYQVRLISFPSGKVHEAVTENEDGTYTIFIDCALSRPEQQEFLHALQHIMGDDFRKEDIQTIEYDTHRCNIDITNNNFMYFTKGGFS